ncbi:hypothetical protein AUJ14_03945 [Candidatus Micrarchaeota archaeon CG1_02_55_22]|nr:MAG: hypothetical protein AUJ14_03945 [Candidatus Micrarchaeota archaeon CG1_02_55_22]
MKPVLITVTVPVKNEEKHLRKCLDALLYQDYPNYEIICSYNRSDDASLEILEEYASKGLIRLYRDDDGNNVTSRNKLFRESHGDIILLFHARSIAEKQFLSTLAKKLDENPDAAGVCANIHYPQDAHPISKAVCVTMHSWLGGHGTSYRRVRNDEAVDCPLLTAYRREVLEKTGFFDPYYNVGDDADYNERARRQGFHFMKTPETRHYQYMRDSLPKFAKRIFVYGMERAKVFTHHGSSPKIYLAPSLALLFFTATLILALARPNYMPFVQLELAAYAIIVLSFSIKEALENDLSLLPLLPVMYAVEHFFYAVGMLAGLIAYAPGRRHAHGTRPTTQQT